MSFELFSFKEKPDHACDVFQGVRRVGEIKKVLNGWRFMKQGQKHIPTPVFRSRLAVQDWLVETKGV